MFRVRYREWATARGYEGGTLEGYIAHGAKVYERFQIGMRTTAELDLLENAVWPDGALKRVDAKASVHFKGKTYRLNPNEATALRNVLKFERETRARPPKPHLLKGGESGDLDAVPPLNLTDLREKIEASIVVRRGSAKFRDSLIIAYQGRCALTDCDLTEALEAAHIVPYCGPQSDLVDNGILLRADIHTLFDLGLISIDPDTLDVSCSAKSGRAGYPQLAPKLKVPECVKRKTLSDRLRKRRAVFAALELDAG